MSVMFWAAMMFRYVLSSTAKYTGDIGAGWLQARQHEREFENALKILFKEELHDKDTGIFCDKKFQALLSE